MNKNLILAGVVGLVLSGIPLFSRKTFAYKGDPSMQGPNYTPERHDAMTKAFEDKDYNAWKELMQGKGRVTQVITEQNFARFVEAHKLALGGDKDGAQKIRQELGLGLQNGSGRGSWQGAGGGYGRNANR